MKQVFDKIWPASLKASVLDERGSKNKQTDKNKTTPPHQKKHKIKFETIESKNNNNNFKYSNTDHQM